MKNLFKASILAVAVTTGYSANAVDGTVAVGDNTITSTGDVQISLSVPHVIQVSRLNDIDLGNADLVTSTDSVGSDQFCVRSNSTVGFDISFDSSTNPSGATFQLEGANTTSKLDYTLEYATVDSAGTVSAYTATTPGTVISLSEQRKAANCNVAGSPADNVEMRVTVSNLLIEQQSAEDFSDLVTIVVSPQ